MKPLHVLFWIAGTILPSVVAGHVLLSRTRAYPVWTKIVWIIGGLIGFAWGLLGWVVEHWQQYGLNRHTYVSLVGIRGTLWGVILGFTTIFALAERYAAGSKSGGAKEGGNQQ